MKLFDQLIKQLEKLAEEALPEVLKASSKEALFEAKTKFLGKKGLLSEALKLLKDLSAEERPQAGAVANRIRDTLEKAFTESLARIEDAEIESKLATEKIDISLPGRKPRIGAIHPLVQVRQRLLGIFSLLGFTQASGPEVETEFCNFEALNVPKDHPARDMQDTLYVSPGVVLRTHTSSMQIRSMLANPPPIKVVATGAVYRNDAVDATHSPMFHQIEGLYIDRGVTMADLKGTLEAFVRELFGSNTKVRLRPSYFPFTEPSVEVDSSCGFCGGKGCRICKHTGWIEILGAGMVNPAVLRAVGSDPEKYQGFAFGLGVERAAMLFLDVDDIRLLYENDLRFLEQFSG
jgi:phenylalanyl-tRNA synthetase alpha chain